MGKIYDNGNEQFALRFRTAVKERGMKMREVAKITGISEGCLSQYASGRCLPKRTRIIKIAHAIKVSPVWLVGLSDDMDELDIEVITLRMEMSDRVKEMTKEQLEKTISFIDGFILNKKGDI